jgi:hypothetical protein
MVASFTGSVSRWIAQLKAGDHAAAEGLWDRYFRRLVTLARRQLRGRPRRGRGGCSPQRLYQPLPGC